ncbi:MAG TPA: TonB family protein [Firmicutes bacterium]|nr:TonB family protein [Bacillota bacterium]
MESRERAYAKRFGASLGISLIVHALIIFLIPLGFMSPVTIYPVEYGDVTDAILASERASSSTPAVPRPPSPPATAPKAPPVTTVVKEEVPAKPVEKQVPSQEPEPVEKPALKKPVEREMKPEIRPKLPQPKTPWEPDIEEPRREGKPDILTSPAGEESIETHSSKEGPPQVQAPDTKTGVKPLGEPSPSAGTSEPASGAPEAVPGAGEARGASGGTRLRPEQFGTGESLVTAAARPVYPKNAQNEGVEGTVEALATVSPEGRLLAVSITKSSGDPRLDAIVVRTMEKAWSFKAIGVEYNIRINVVFSGARVSVSFGGVTFAQ